jgi:hypothetical protein
MEHGFIGAEPFADGSQLHMIKALSCVGGFRFQHFCMADSSDPCQAALKVKEHRQEDCWPTE